MTHPNITIKIPQNNTLSPIAKNPKPDLVERLPKIGSRSASSSSLDSTQTSHNASSSNISEETNISLETEVSSPKGKGPLHPDYSTTPYSDGEQTLSPIKHRPDLLMSAQKSAASRKSLFSKPSPEERYLYEGDDSSDEEDEERVYNSPIDFARYQEDELFEKVGSSNLNFSTALFLQDMGMRLLASTPVRKIYFPKKRSLGEFKNLPSDQEIKALLKNFIKSLLSYEGKANSTESIVNSEEFTKFLQMLVTNKRYCFAPKHLKEKDGLVKLLEKVNTHLAQRSEDTGMKQAAVERHIKAYIDSLTKQPEFLTSEKYICVAKNVRGSFNSYVEKKKQDLTLMASQGPYLKALEQAYQELKRNQTSKKLMKLAIKKFNEAQTEEHQEQMSLDTFTDKMVEYFKASTIRPTLDYSTTMSAKDFDNSEGDSHSGTFLAHMRLIHCSSKRYIKNEKALPESERYGASFSRAWKFDPKKNICTITTKKLTESLCMVDKVVYPHNSTYTHLVEQFSKFNITIKTSIKCIKSLLKGQALPEVPSNFEKFISIFTYNIFGVEVERHPAAALHHMIGLDLMTKKGHDWNWFKNNMPMAIKGAISVCRHLDIALKNKATIPYYYDNDKANVASSASEELKGFITKEESLLLEWVRSKGLEEILVLLDDSSSKQEASINDKLVEALDTLCYDYLGLHLQEKDMEPSELDTTLATEAKALTISGEESSLAHTE